MSAATQAFLSLAFGLFITGQFSKFAKPQTILDEIQIIQEIGLSGWFESRKK